MLHEGTLHKCIKQLLEKKKHTRDEEMVEDMECLCQIIRTVGLRLDTEQARVSFFFSLYDLRTMSLEFSV